MRKYYLLLLTIVPILVGVLWLLEDRDTTDIQPRDEAVAFVSEAQAADTERTEVIVVEEGMTFGSIAEEVGIGGALAMELLQAAEELYDLTTIRIGKPLAFTFDTTSGDLLYLVYEINSEEELLIEEKNDVWTAVLRPIAYDVRIKTVTGTITSSLYAAALEQGIDERAIIGLADVFQWTVDFAYEVQKDDSFTFTYEERYRDGEYVMPGSILAGKFVNNGEEHYAFYFAPDDEHEGYYDAEGNSVQKIFLKTPVAFKYISSGFTTGARYVPGFNQYTSSHKAIDYAANTGTPVRSVGDGAVILAGWSGSYGNKISVRHNSTYTTNYAHLSGYAVKRGQKVEQGQVIGYVGSTGYSTGPHLHYEMVKHGTKINPLREVLPPGEAIDEAYQPVFEEVRDNFMKLLR